MILAEAIKRAAPSYSRIDIIRHFLDFDRSAFSIHEITRQGEITENKKPGDWYGVVSISSVLNEIFINGTQAQNKFDIFTRLNLITFSDGVVIRSKVIEKLMEVEKPDAERKQSFEVV